MTNIQDTKNKIVLVPDGFYTNSPLLHDKSKTLKDLRNVLSLQWWSEVEIRFVDKAWKAVNFIDGKKTNLVVANYILEQFPWVNVTFESSANMIELDTGICQTYEELISQLKLLQSIKEQILKKFGLEEWPAYVTEIELSEDFVDPIDDQIHQLIESHGIEKAEDIISKRNEDQKKSCWLHIASFSWMKYVINVQKTMSNEMKNYTKTTSQQLTLSSKSHEITLWFHVQMLNTIYEYYVKNKKSFLPWTGMRWEQRRKVVDYRALHGIGVKNWYEPKFPWPDYRKYFKRNYFENNIKDDYIIWNIEKFVMSHWPQSKKFSLNNQWVPIPRTEFRLQDSLPNILDAHKSTEKIFELMLASAHKNNPMYNYHFKEIKKSK